ncbi:putative 56K protein [Pyrrhocoris apterus virus 1]|nr:putative 56K protein [Pyrrhocoris apterus virus 1]
MANFGVSNLRTINSNNESPRVFNVSQGGSVRKGGQKFGEDVSNAFILMITNLTQAPLIFGFYIYLNISVLTVYFTRTSMLYTMFLKFIQGKYYYPFSGLLKFWYYYISIECNHFYWFAILGFIGIIYLLKPSNKNFIFCVNLLLVVVSVRLRFIDILVFGNLCVWLVLFRAPVQKLSMFLFTVMILFIRIKFTVPLDYYPVCLLCQKTYSLRDNYWYDVRPVVFPVCYNLTDCPVLNGGDLVMIRTCGGCVESPFLNFYNFTLHGNKPCTPNDYPQRYQTATNLLVRKKLPVPDDFYDGVWSPWVSAELDPPWFNFSSNHNHSSKHKKHHHSHSTNVHIKSTYLPVVSSTTPIPRINPTSTTTHVPVSITTTKPTFVKNTTLNSDDSFRLATSSSIGFNTTSTLHPNWLFNYMDNLAYYKPSNSNNYVLMENSTHIVPFKVMGLEDALTVTGLGKMVVKSGRPRCRSYLDLNKQGGKTLEAACPIL